MSYLARLEQVCVEDLYSKEQTRSLVLKDLEEDLGEPVDKAVELLFNYFDKKYSYDSKNIRLQEYVENSDFDLEKLVNEILIIILPKPKGMSIQMVVGQLAPLLNYENHWDGIKTAAEIITVVCESDLYDIIPARHAESGSIEVISNYRLSKEITDKLNNMQYLPPLVCKPDTITSNYQSAYLTKNESLILGKGNHHDDSLGIDAVNIANSVELSLDEWVMSQKETSKKPLDTLEKQANFIRMRKSSNIVYKELKASGNRFYLSWRFCKRGRMYSSGYHVNIQASEYKKALINLANKQVIQLT